VGWVRSASQPVEAQPHCLLQRHGRVAEVTRTLLHLYTAAMCANRVNEIRVEGTEGSGVDSLWINMGHVASP